jgi:hypothetical protein
MNRAAGREYERMVVLEAITPEQTLPATRRVQRWFDD